MEQRKVTELNIDDVLPNRFQPRIKFNEEAITELSNSIKEHGVIQPIVVRPIGDKYEIIAGERRYKASCMAGLQTIPAIITDLNDKDSAEVALIENVQRENLTPIEEAISYKKILDMGYITQEALATKLGKTQSTVANKLRLLNLDDEVQEALLKEKISERHARSLLKLQDKEQQRNMLNRIIAERLPVRKTDEEIEKILAGNKTETKEASEFEEQDEIEAVQEELQKDIETPSFKFINFPSNSNEEIKENPENEENKEELKQGKFFNILKEETEEKPEEEPQTEFNFESIFMNPTNNTNPNALMEEINEIEKSINNSNQKSEKNNAKENPVEEKSEPIEEFDDFDADFEPIEDEIEETEEKPEEEQIEKNKESKISNFKDVLQSIRGVSDKIEAAGFKIDTEEYDLEGTYQVIFKISKED